MMGPFQPIPSLVSVMNQANADATRQTMGIASVLGQMQEGELRRYQLKAAKQDAEIKAAQQKAIQDLIAGIQDPTQRTAATLNPTEYGKSLLREPQKLEYFDPATGRRTFGWAKPGEQPMQIGGVEKKLLTPEEIANAAAAKEAEERATYPYKRSVAASGAARVNVGAPSIIMPKDLSQSAAKILEDSKAKATSSANTLRSISQINQALNTGNFRLGPGAPALQVMDQLGVTLGVAGKDTAERAANTRSLMQGMAQQELDAAEQLRGQGQITEKERELVARAALGNIGNITEPELRLLTGALEKTARLKLQKHKKMVDFTEKNYPGSDVYFNVDAPEPTTSAAPEGRKPIRTGKLNGKTVIQYSDGSMEYQ